MTTGRSTSNTGLSLALLRQIADQQTQQGTDLKTLTLAVQDLKLDTARKSETYDRAVMDEKLLALKNDINDIRKAGESAKNLFWKMLGGGSSAAVIIFYAYQALHH